MDVNCCCVWSAAATAAYSDFCHYPSGAQLSASVAPSGQQPPVSVGAAPASPYTTAAGFLGPNRDSAPFILPLYHGQAAVVEAPVFLLQAGASVAPSATPSSNLTPTATPANQQHHHHHRAHQMSHTCYPAPASISQQAIPAGYLPTGSLQPQPLAGLYQTPHQMARPPTSLPLAHHHHHHHQQQYAASPQTTYYITHPPLRSHQPPAYLAYDPAGLLCQHPVCQQHELASRNQQLAGLQAPPPLLLEQPPAQLLPAPQANLNCYNLLAALPIEAEPARTRQAYGMDKVWSDEFEQLFLQLVSNVVWTLVELESSPSIRDSKSILGYKGHYLIRLGEGPLSCELLEGSSQALAEAPAEALASEQAESSIETADTDDCNTSPDSGEEQEGEHSPQVSACPSPATTSAEESADEEETNEDEEEPNGAGSGVDSDDSGLNSSSCSSSVEPARQGSSSGAQQEPPAAPASPGRRQEGDAGGQRRHQNKFRMYIDSAKVRFCCDNCGHGWTSMKGRVVFWYELFELLPAGSELAPAEQLHSQPPDQQPKQTQSSQNNQVVGYCAYKLFGQQCDVCKIENRFERPMWYPEEVSKVLNNLYNRIGQIYFGFKMPAIDKQRRAGKPKTSHNSSLCQACHDGVCTDRK